MFLYCYQCTNMPKDRCVHLLGRRGATPFSSVDGCGYFLMKAEERARLAAQTAEPPSAPDWVQPPAIFAACPTCGATIYAGGPCERCTP